MKGDQCQQRGDVSIGRSRAGSRALKSCTYSTAGPSMTAFTLFITCTVIRNFPSSLTSIGVSYGLKIEPGFCLYPAKKSRAFFLAWPRGRNPRLFTIMRIIFEIGPLGRFNMPRFGRRDAGWGSRKQRPPGVLRDAGHGRGFGVGEKFMNHRDDDSVDRRTK